MQFNGVVKSKLSGVGTSIFAVMSQLANEQKAINLAQGFPNFMCNKDLISLVNKFMNKGFNQYLPKTSSTEPSCCIIARSVCSIVGCVICAFAAA